MRLSLTSLKSNNEEDDDGGGGGGVLSSASSEVEEDEKKRWMKEGLGFRFGFLRTIFRALDAIRFLGLGVSGCCLPSTTFLFHFFRRW